MFAISSDHLKEAAERISVTNLHHQLLKIASDSN